MPALSVSIDRKVIATVCTEGLDSLQVRVCGIRLAEELALLEMRGGSYPAKPIGHGPERRWVVEGKSTSLIWVSDLALQANQLVTVLFLESAPSSHSGKTIDETTITGFTPKLKPEEMFRGLLAKPKHDSYSFHLESSQGTSFVGETEPQEIAFTFSVIWDSSCPESARVSLHGDSLESIATFGFGPMTKYVQEHIQFGGWVNFEIVA